MSKLRVSSHRLLIEQEGGINRNQYLGMDDCVKFATNWKMNIIFYWSVPFLLMKERNILNHIM